MKESLKRRLDTKKKKKNNYYIRINKRHRKLMMRVRVLLSLIAGHKLTQLLRTVECEQSKLFRFRGQQQCATLSNKESWWIIKGYEKPRYNYFSQSAELVQLQIVKK